MNEFQKLEQRVKKLEDVTNLSQFDSFTERIRLNAKEIVLREVAANDGAVDRQITITIGSEGGSDSEQVLDYPDGFLEVSFNGRQIVLPYFLKSRF